MEVQKCINMIWCICFYLPSPYFSSFTLIPFPTLSSLSSLPPSSSLLFYTYSFFSSLRYFLVLSALTLPILLSDIYAQSACVHTQIYKHAYTEWFMNASFNVVILSVTLFPVRNITHTSDSLELQIYRPINAPKKCEQAHDRPYRIGCRIYNECSKWRAAVNTTFRSIYQKKSRGLRSGDLDGH